MIYLNDWLIFLSCTAIPVYIALHFAWKIFANIGDDHSFCEVNAKDFTRALYKIANQYLSLELTQPEILPRSPS